MKFVKPLIAITALSAIASPLFFSKAASAEIIIRPFFRRPVIVEPVVPIVPRPVIVEPPAVVSQPVWQSSASSNLYRGDGWVDKNIAVEHTGRKLFLNLDGEAKFDYAEVRFGDGQVERVNLQNRVYGDGEYAIANFGNERYVRSVHLLGRSESERSHVSFLLRA
jgi:hypothetical protein